MNDRTRYFLRLRPLTVAVMLLCFGLVGRDSLAQSPDTGGGSLSSRIIGGQAASPGQFPFMAALVLSSSPNNYYNGFFCGGTLIHRRWVLTAAHCVTTPSGSQFIVDNPSIEYVALKLTNLQTDPGEKRSIQQIIVHPDYNPQTHENDVALLELTQDSTATPIWITNFDVREPTSSTVIGWGVTNADFPQSSPNLNYVNMPIVSNEICEEPYPAGTITSSMLCAGIAAGGLDSCQGDSGGPLLVSQNGVWTVAGIVSFGHGCALAGFYGVYTRVAPFANFIAQYVPSPFSPPSLNVTGPFALWNGFLRMTNILELVNDTGSTQSVTVYLANIDGSIVSKNVYSVANATQLDVIVNTLSGFAANTYGTIRITGNIGGRISYYRPLTAAFRDFDFAFALPLASPVTGRTMVGFNSYQPSLNPNEGSNSVENWLSVVNVASTAKGFTVRKFDQNGTLLVADHISLAGYERSDIDGGHINPGPSHVGLIEIIPDDQSSAYLSQLIRYGRNSSSYDFAFPLIPRAGTTSSLDVPLTTTLNSQNWLEVVNITGTAGTATVNFYRQDGSTAGSTVLTLPARGQIHTNINSIIGNNSLGHAAIVPDGVINVVAQSMVYARNTITGSVDGMYGTQAEHPVAGAITGSYNLYLGQLDWLKIINPSASAVDFDLTFSSLASAGSSRTLHLAPFAGVDVAVNDPAYGTAASTYGTVFIQPHGGAALLSQVLRQKNDSSTGKLQYLMPTAVQ